MDYFCFDLLLLLVEEAIYKLYDLATQFMVGHVQLVLDGLVDEREPLNFVFTECGLIHATVPSRIINFDRDI